MPGRSAGWPQVLVAGACRRAILFPGPPVLADRNDRRGPAVDDAHAVNQQVQGAVGAPIRDLDGACLLPPTQGRIIRHGPVQIRQRRQNGHHPASPWSLGPVAFPWFDLPQGQLEQQLDGQAKPDRRVREHRGAAKAAVMRREPGHVLVQPDQRGPALAERGSVARPVRPAVAGGCRVAHTAGLTAWNHIVTTRRTEFCNNTHPRHQ